MRIVLCVNHSYPHTGGAEKVVKQISEAMSVEYGHDVSVLSCSVTKNFSHNGVKYISCSRDSNAYLSSLKKLNPDHTHVYSDCFFHWQTLIQNVDSIQGTKSIALVGMNAMRDNERILKSFLPVKDKFFVITHSDNYIDAQKCRAKNISHRVIPNGVELDEFDNTDLDIEERENIILSVANFFPGKGQDHLAHIANLLIEKRSDYKIVYVYSSVNFAFSNILERKTRQILSGYKGECEFVKDIDRDKVVKYFKKAKLFAFTSQKEVAPLVLLEAQAAKTPWLSLPVGNAQELEGGIVIPHAGLDSKGYCRLSADVYQEYVNNISNLLDNKSLYKDLSDRGRKQIEEIYNWSNITQLYNEVFTS